MNSYSDKAINGKVKTKNNQQNNKPVKKKKVKKQHLLFYKLVSFILIILTVFTFGMVIYNDYIKKTIFE